MNPDQLCRRTRTGRVRAALATKGPGGACRQLVPTASFTSIWYFLRNVNEVKLFPVQTSRLTSTRATADRAFGTDASSCVRVRSASENVLVPG